MNEPRLDSLGFLADRAMVLGDPGPRLCSGMTGGVVCLRLDPELGLTREAVGERLALGSPARVREVGWKGERDLEELIEACRRELRRSPLATAEGEARWVEGRLPHSREAFVALRPGPETSGTKPDTIGD